MHSPFVFQFILHVLNNKSGYVPPKEIEKLRKKLLHDKRVLEVEDFGAGSRVATHKKRSVAELVDDRAPLARERFRRQAPQCAEQRVLGGRVGHIGQRRHEGDEGRARDAVRDIV